MKIDFNLKLAIGILLGFGILYVGFLAYEPIWFKVQEWKLESEDTETRNSAIKNLSEKGEEVLPRVKKWMNSSNPALATGACHILVLVKKYFDGPVKNIMLCPQGSGYPLFAVFEETDYAPKDKTKGHVELIDHNGDMLKYYNGANVIEGAFEDINDDGIIENVDTIPYMVDKNPCGADILHILPVTKTQKPILRIAYNKNWANKWAWELVESGTPGIFNLAIGPIDNNTGKVMPEAVYKWSQVDKKYEGPKGGLDMPFMRLDGDCPYSFDDFVK